jgi:hypothetical protein
MKRILTTLAASGFLAVTAGPAVADCGGMHAQSVSAPPTSQDQVVQGEQQTPPPTQTASTKEKSE